ncbi:MAG: hypothetical protein CMP96_01960 [Gammaproteobacteria bacterium]|jgi:hypothetical protein|nr:hypothetical protein [Gammaproteobacteria bacterium]
MSQHATKKSQRESTDGILSAYHLREPDAHSSEMRQYQPFGSRALVGSRSRMKRSVKETDHSRLAMRAAKRVKSSRDKQRTSHLVCTHLKALLDGRSEEDKQCRAMRRALSARQESNGRQVPLPI